MSTFMVAIASITTEKITFILFRIYVGWNHQLFYIVFIDNFPFLSISKLIIFFLHLLVKHMQNLPYQISKTPSNKKQASVILVRVAISLRELIVVVASTNLLSIRLSLIYIIGFLIAFLNLFCKCLTSTYQLNIMDQNSQKPD